VSNTSQGRKSASRPLFGFLDACSPYDDYLLRRLERVAVGAEETFEKGHLVASHYLFTRPLPETVKPSADRALILVNPLLLRTHRIWAIDACSAKASGSPVAWANARIAIRTVP
jgi:hypothetical protein